jgi:hypothetical protein
MFEARLKLETGSKNKKERETATSKRTILSRFLCSLMWLCDQILVSKVEVEVESFLNIHVELIPGHPQLPKSVAAHPFYIKWHSICL